MARRIITIPRPSGGLSHSLYEDVRRGTYRKFYNLDGEDGSIVRPLGKFVNITPPAAGDSDFAPRNCLKASDDKYYFVGQITDTENKWALYNTDTAGLVAAPTWEQGIGDSDTFIVTNLTNDALEEFKDGILWGAGNTLRRFGDLSGAPVNSNLDTTLTTNPTFIRKNEGLGLAFYIHDAGRRIGSYNNDTVVTSALTLGKDETAVGIEPSGRFNVVGVRQLAEPDKFYVWDGSASTVDDVLPTSDIGLQAFRVIGSKIHYITATDIADHTRYFRYYHYSLGASKPTLIREFKVGTAGRTLEVNANAVEVAGNNFQFAFGTHSMELLDNLIYQYGALDERAEDRLHTHRTDLNNETSDIEYIAIRKLIDRYVIIHRNDSSDRPYKIEAILDNSAFDANGVYETPAFPINKDFPGMPAQIKAIHMNHPPMDSLGSGAGFTVSVNHYGRYPAPTTPPGADSFTVIETKDGSDTTFGATQITGSAEFTEVTGKDTAGGHAFDVARHAQIRINFDKVSGTNIPEILFPINVEVETEITRP